MCGVRKYLDNRLFLESGDAQNLESCVEAPVQVLLVFIGHPFEIEMATGYGRIEIDHVVNIGYYPDSNELFRL